MHNKKAHIFYALLVFTYHLLYLGLYHYDVHIHHMLSLIHIFRYSSKTFLIAFPIGIITNFLFLVTLIYINSLSKSKSSILTFLKLLLLTPVATKYYYHFIIMKAIICKYFLIYNINKFFNKILICKYIFRIFKFKYSFKILFRFHYISM